MRTRRLVAWAFATVVLAAGTLVGTASAGHALTPVRGSVRQVYTPGAPGVPSRTIPTCTAPNTPTGCYAGQLLTLQGARIGHTAMEPTIGIAPDGTAYMAGASLDIDTNVAWGVAATDAMRSTDGGLTWTSVQPTIPGVGKSNPPGNADPMIYVDPVTGRVFTFDLTAACNWLSYSDDKGATWTTNPVACGNVPVDHQTIVSAKPRGGFPTVGYPDALYWCSNRVIEATCGRSLDGGLTWTPGGTDAYSGFDASHNLCSSITGHLAADADGRLFLPSAHCGFPEIAVSDDGAVTWTDVTVSSMATDVAHTSVAADSAGNLYYVWVGSADQLPYLSTSKNHGKTWSPPKMIAPPRVAQVNFPVVAAGAPGHIAVSFPSSTTKVSTSPWSQTVVVTTNALAAAPRYVSATGNPPSDPIHRGGCLDRCGGLWDFIDVQIDSHGNVWTSTSDDCTGTCNTGKVSSAHAGDGIAIREIGGPRLR